MNAAIFIAVIEDYYKSYLVISEYLQLDPTIVHNIGTVQARCDIMQLMLDDVDEKQKAKLKKKLDWFVKKYKTLTADGLRGYGFAKRAQKALKKGQLILAEGTVSENPTAYTISQKNYDYYINKQKKPALIAAGITLAVLLVAGISIALFFIL